MAVVNAILYIILIVLIILIIVALTFLAGAMIWIVYESCTKDRGGVDEEMGGSRGFDGEEIKDDR